MNSSPSTTTTPSTQISAPDQSEKATQIIKLALLLEPEAQGIAVARIIAATLHDGPGTALERFAATGNLDAESVLDELNDVRVPFEQEAWVDALARHILFTKGGQS
ncbi:hypothetical protein ICL81_06650 [Leucobacter sp. cx-328]|uniref:hypothetical protein n=1 Tax=unclassified Leucobacter TaxID=2621730 RepID=UPI00165E0CBA|nr:MULTISPECIES: hypothetical protein [unclassified Leucobacter]MBC9944192.1 hypothetical protein [Leucobacter sp. cx-328]